MHHSRFIPPSIALLVAIVEGHGRILSPKPREIGDAFKAACGQQVYSQMSSDPNGNIQSMANTGSSQPDYDAAKCNLSECKGFKFEDNKDNVQTFTPGQTVNFKIQISAPHTGTAIVAILNLRTHQNIGEPLISFTNYASTSTGVSANNTDFSVVIPQNLEECGVASYCAIQWVWDAPSVNQTYISCVDFTTGSGSTSPAGEKLAVESVGIGGGETGLGGGGTGSETKETGKTGGKSNDGPDGKPGKSDGKSDVGSGGGIKGVSSGRKKKCRSSKHRRHASTQKANKGPYQT